MTRPPTPHPGAARLANPAVRRRMREVIGRQVQEQDAKDVVQSALVSLLLMAPHLPASDDGLLGLVVVVTRHKLVDHARRVTVRDGRDAAVEDLDALPERNAPPSPETRATWAAMLALVEREIAAGNVPPEVLGWAIGLAEGKTIAEMAREGDVSESRIKMALKRSREVLNLRWKEISGAAGLGLLLVLAALWLPKRGAPPDIQAEPAPRAPPSATASASPGPSAPAVQAPQALRDRARTRCAARDWAGCEDALDEAAAQDPDSERRPDVIAMREAIARGVKADRQGDKPPTP